MKFNKFISLAIIIIILFTSNIFADGITQKHVDVANSLVTMGYVYGYTDGELKLDRNITRAEFTALAVRLINKEYLLDEFKGDTIFSDVNEDHWASSYINIAVKENIISGYGDNTFRPENNISHAEILTILVRILGYYDTELKGPYWYSYYVDKAYELGISYDNNASSDSYALRGDVFLYIYNSLPIFLDKKY